MRRKKSNPSSSGLLLDTMCNALGAVLFLALLVILLSKQIPVDLPPSPIPPSTMTLDDPAEILRELQDKIGNLPPTHQLQAAQLTLREQRKTLELSTIKDAQGGESSDGKEPDPTTSAHAPIPFPLRLDDMYQALAFYTAETMARRGLTSIYNVPYSGELSHVYIMNGRVYVNPEPDPRSRRRPARRSLFQNEDGYYDVRPWVSVSDEIDRQLGKLPLQVKKYGLQMRFAFVMIPQGPGQTIESSLYTLGGHHPALSVRVMWDDIDTYEEFRKRYAQMFPNAPTQFLVHPLLPFNGQSSQDYLNE